MNTLYQDLKELRDTTQALADQTCLKNDIELYQAFADSLTKVMEKHSEETEVPNMKTFKVYSDGPDHAFVDAQPFEIEVEHRSDLYRAVAEHQDEIDEDESFYPERLMEEHGLLIWSWTSGDQHDWPITYIAINHDRISSQRLKLLNALIGI